jgi:hypothetical protein
VKYVITYKGNKDQLLTLDNTITNDINRAATFGCKEDAKDWLWDIKVLYHRGRLLDNLEVTKVK